MEDDTDHDGVPLSGTDLQIVCRVRNHVDTIRFYDCECVSLDGKAEQANGRGVDDSETVSFSCFYIYYCSVCEGTVEVPPS